MEDEDDLSATGASRQTRGGQATTLDDVDIEKFRMVVSEVHAFDWREKSASKSSFYAHWTAKVRLSSSTAHTAVPEVSDYAHAYSIPTKASRFHTFVGGTTYYSIERARNGGSVER